jgi:hypothetical protein
MCNELSQHCGYITLIIINFPNIHSIKMTRNICDYSKIRGCDMNTSQSKKILNLLKDKNLIVASNRGPVEFHIRMITRDETGCWGACFHIITHLWII